VTPALSIAVEHLEAERLAPVPRNSHAVAVDVDDLALLLEHVHEHTLHGPMRGEAAAAYGRLDKTVRCHA